MSEICTKAICDFQPRYSETMPDNYTIPESNYDVDVDDLVSLIEAIKNKVYVHDVCVNCGKVSVKV